MTDAFFTPSPHTFIDVNGAKGPVDWRAVKQAGHAGCFVKATEGQTFKDERFQQHRRDAAAQGLFVGAYHFARPSRNTVDAELKNFLGAVGKGRELLVLDFEDDGGHGDLSGWAWKFCQGVEYLTGRPPMIYTYGPYWKAHGSTDPKFQHYPLWLAAYAKTAPPLAPWSRWKFWQYTDCGSVPGVGGKVDVSHFDGAPAELWALFKGKP